MVFTMEEVWLSRFSGEGSSVHLMQFAQPLDEWKNPDLAKKWDLIRKVRGAVTGAMEIERANKTIGSSLEAAPDVYIELGMPEFDAVKSCDFAEVCITSSINIVNDASPSNAFTTENEKRIGVIVHKAQGQKCARSWKISKDIGIDKDFPDITPRDAAAVREWMHRFGKTV